MATSHPLQPVPQAGTTPADFEETLRGLQEELTHISQQLEHAAGCCRRMLQEPAATASYDTRRDMQHLQARIEGLHEQMAQANRTVARLVAGGKGEPDVPPPRWPMLKGPQDAHGR